MALIIKDRVKEGTTTSGTGDITLAGSSATFDSFNSYMTNGDTSYYAIEHTSSGINEWEVGLGTWNTGNTLSRTTVLAGSAGTSAVDFSAGTKNIFMTYPSAIAAFTDGSGDLSSLIGLGNHTTTDVAEGSNLYFTTGRIDSHLSGGTGVTYNAGAISIGQAVATTSNVTFNTVALSGDPVTALQAATKEYVDTIAAAGIHYHERVRVEAAVNRPATYDNGTSGVGATLTNSGTQEVLVIDGVTVDVADRVLITQQTNTAHNGVYTVTNVGSASTNWVLTRATDADSYGASDKDALGEGDAYFVKEGLTGAGELYVMNTSGVITFGTTPITFTVIAETAIYSAGTGLTLTGTEFATVQDIATGASPTFVTVNANLLGNVTGNVTGNVSGSSGSTTGNAATATKLATARTVQLSGDVTGSASFDGSANINIVASVGDDSHAHIISNVDGLQTALDSKVDDSQTITAGTGLTGGGDLTVNRTLSLDTTYTDARYVNATGDTMTGNLAVQGAFTSLGIDDNATSTAMTLDSSGNLLVGGTSAAEAGALTVYPTGIVQARVIGANAIIADRTSSDGEIIDLRKDGTTVGSIGSSSGKLKVSSVDTGLIFGDAFDEIYPLSNGITTLGDPGARFKDLYLSGTAYATTFSGALSGNATTATALQTARTINGVSFNGSANITVADATKLPLTGGAITGAITTTSTFDGRDVSVDGAKLDGIAAGANNYSFPYTISAAESNNTVVIRHSSGYIFGNYFGGTGTFSTTGDTSGMGRFTGTNGTDTYGRSYTAAAARTLLNVADGATNVTNTNQLTNGAGYITSSASISGNAATATTLQTARTINGVSFNGSANITVADGTKLPLAGGTMTGNTYVNSYGIGNVGLYSADKYQAVFAMGDSYKLPADGSTTGTLYGIAWTHPNVGGQSISTLGHQALFMENGVTKSAIGVGVWTSGNVTAYSDIRVKENLVVIPNAIDKVKQINGYTYDRTDQAPTSLEEDVIFTHNPSKRHVGLIAQELIKVLPEAVTGGPNNRGGSEDDHYSVAYGNVVALLVEAIKEQDDKVGVLIEAIKELKLEIEILKGN